jgi:multidrug efflux system membrane fusion protein
MTRLRRIWIAAGTVAVLFGVYEVATSYVAYTADAYVQSDLVTVAPQVTGRIIAVNVEDNQAVSEGDLLASVDPVPFQLVNDQREAELAEVRAQIKGDQDLIASAKDSLVAAESAAAYARETFARLSALASDQDLSRAALDQATDAQRRADLAVDGQRQAVARIEANAAMHQAAESKAAAVLATAQWQLARTKLTAPTSGTINNLTLRIGDTAQADVPLIGIVDAKAWRIVANYKQSFIREFSPGTSAWVWLDSEPWRLHRARVTGIARGVSRDPVPGGLLPYVAPTTDWIRLQRRFPVTLALVDPPPDLKLYMGADARVVILP